MRPAMLAILLLGGAPAVAADRDFPAAGFDKVELAAGASVDIHTGGRFAVHADGDPQLIDQLAIRVVQNTLVIGWTRDHANRNGHQRLHLRVSMPRVSSVLLSGAGPITIDRVDAPDFTAALRGAGSIDLPALHSARARFVMGGAGRITAAGSAGALDAQVHGFGAIEAANLAARAGRLTMAGTGSIKARVDGPADIFMSGVGSVDVTGHPRCAIHKSGLGSVHCAG